MCQKSHINCHLTANFINEILFVAKENLYVALGFLIFKLPA